MGIYEAMSLLIGTVLGAMVVLLILGAIGNGWE